MRQTGRLRHTIRKPVSSMSTRSKERLSITLPMTAQNLQAIDPLTGNAVWRHAYPNLNNAPATLGPSILTTASNLLITGDDQNNAIIYSADKGEVLWHHEISANESGGVITYMLD